MALLWQRYPDAIRERYGIEEVEESTGFLGYDLLITAGRNRGFLMARGEINTERMAKVLIDEYRSGKLGRFTLEEPEENV
jgi:ribosome biogenesis GTPase A